MMICLLLHYRTTIRVFITKSIASSISKDGRIPTIIRRCRANTVAVAAVLVVVVGGGRRRLSGVVSRRAGVAVVVVAGEVMVPDLRVVRELPELSPSSGVSDNFEDFLFISPSCYCHLLQAHVYVHFFHS